MKRLKLCIVILSVLFILNGCTKPIELTDEETDMFAEYISNEVLRRDKNYDQELLTPEYNEDDTDTKSSGSVSHEDQTSQGTTNVGYSVGTSTNATKLEDASVNDILGNSSITAEYRSAKYYDSYPEDGNNYFVIASSEGYRLLVVTFDLKNTTKKDVTYSMLATDVSYKLTMESGSTYSPLLTLLVDDLQFIDKVIPASKTQEGVLVFRIAENEVKSSGMLQITDDSKSATIEVK